MVFGRQGRTTLAKNGFRSKRAGKCKKNMVFGQKGQEHVRKNRFQSRRQENPRKFWFPVREAGKRNNIRLLVIGLLVSGLLVIRIFA